MADSAGGKMLEGLKKTSISVTITRHILIYADIMYHSNNEQ